MTVDPRTEDWNPERYLQFEQERERPALDLLQRVPERELGCVWDLGCGPGHLTLLLRQRWPEARVVAVDRSRSMLERARSLDSDIEWRRGDIAELDFSPRPDLLFSNAALHWLPRHRRVFPHLLRQLRPGGILAVQMPLSWAQPSHSLIRETVARGGPLGASLGSPDLRRRLHRTHVLAPEDYVRLLGAEATVDVWATEYVHVLEGEEPVFEWVATTALRPVLAALDDLETERFLRRYRMALLEAYPPEPDGRTLFPFRRLFVVAERNR
jgi:trans-aconitate 2-methyltransferase